MQEAVEEEKQSLDEEETDDIKVIVIGVSGATRSGKGTLARKLRDELGGRDTVQWVCQDAFFDRKIIYEELDGNWEDPRALNHDAYLWKVNDAIKKCKIASMKYVILEGFLLFHDQRIVELLDYKFWLEISKEICHDRRMRTKPVPEIYFQKNLWPGYQAYRKTVFDNKQFVSELIEINGTLKTQIILQTALTSMEIDYQISDDKDELFEQIQQNDQQKQKSACVSCVLL